MFSLFVLLTIAGEVLAGVGAGTFNYVSFNDWSGYCNYNGDVTKQQSPVNIPLASVDGSVDLTFTNFFRGSLSLSQYLKESAEGNLAMILNFKHNNVDDNPSAFYFQGIHYTLDHVHSHWGSSEHIVDGVGTHGSLHFVFKGDSPESRWTPLEANFAVIELMVKFVDYDDDDTVFKGFPRCPAPSEEIKERLVSADCRKPSKVLNFDPELEIDSSENTGTAFMAAMTRFRGGSGSMVHYVGSLTTPPCSGPVQWFVITEPLKIYDVVGDWLGCDVFAASFPRVESEGDICSKHGNYRTVQDIKDMTVFNDVKIGYKKNFGGKRDNKGKKLKPVKEDKKQAKGGKPDRFL